MLRDMFSHRGIQLCLVFVVVFVSGSLFYSWHVKRTTDAVLGEVDVLPQRAAEENPEPHPGQVSNGFRADTERLGLDADGIGEISDEVTPAAAMEESLDDLDDMVDAFLPDGFVSEEEATAAEDVRVSPFGFGPYPEVPADYPSRPPWEREGYTTFSEDTQKGLELLGRVLIKLWQQGERGYLGGSTSDGKVYPHYKNTAYVRYETTDSGRRSIARYKGDPAIRITPEQLRAGELPSYIRVLDIDAEGIEPYEFLGFSK